MSASTDQDGRQGPDPGEDLTRYLRLMSQGDKDAEGKAYELLMPELRRLAHLFVRQQRSTNTIQTTALVNEVYLKLIGYKSKEWEDRRHFLALAVRAMRSILIDEARGRNRLKRLPPGKRITIQAIGVAREPTDILELFEALDALRARDAVAAEVVSLRYFCGLGAEETANTMGTSERTVTRKWSIARVFLEDWLTRG